ncbi:MAG: precorrin-3B C(17)-methyltransferase [Clostridiales bacterium]|jgi:precorrin-3B C17-methyltransferase|nr:precorrin-3B C(17)-methyltransferase [Clostridiales bacterium]
MLYVVGIGPGNAENMTMACRAALERADVIAGYNKYVELVAPLYPHKPTVATGMKKEAERCRAALELAAEGKNAALVCSGDAGVYGMAGLVLELAVDFPAVEVEIVSGVTAALAGAALLGAPLAHDFCVISLSDLLTPWELIEKRLRSAAEADFCIALYNPASRKRADYLKQACEILFEQKGADTICGIARNIGRDGERAEITTLGELGGIAVDMFTTVFVGNSQTKIVNGKMVTPRGYALEIFAAKNAAEMALRASLIRQVLL